MPLPATVQTPQGLFVQLQRPRQRQERHPATTMLEVESVSCRLGMDQQQFDLACVPFLDRVLFIDPPRMRVAPLQLQQFLDEVIDDDHVRPLVLLNEIIQQIELVVAEPDRCLGSVPLPRSVRIGRRLRIVDKPRRHLLQFARHHSGVGSDGLRVTELHHEVLLHRVVRFRIRHVAAQLDRVYRRQRVGIVARFQ